MMEDGLVKASRVFEALDMEPLPVRGWEEIEMSFADDLPSGWRLLWPLADEDGEPTSVFFVNAAYRCDEWALRTLLKELRKHVEAWEWEAPRVPLILFAYLSEAS